MKIKNILFNKVKAPIGVVAMCLTVLISQSVSAQGRLETFDTEVLITPVYTSHINGAELDGDANRIRWDYIKDIAPGTGQWFCGTGSGEPRYKWVADAGSNGGGAVAQVYEGTGSSNIFYIFNNKNSSASNYDFTASYRYSTGTTNGGAISYFNIIEPTPADNSSMNWRADNGGTGGFSDNGSVRFKGGNNEGGTWWNPDLAGDVPTDGWRALDAFKNMTGGTDYEGTTGASTGDWIVIGFAFVKTAAEPNVANLILIDEVTLPFGNEDEVAPVATLDSPTPGTIGLFSNEIGRTYLVPAGTPRVEADIKAATLIPETLAIPVTGTAISEAGIADGKYDIYVIDGAGNISIGNQVNIGAADVYAPLITGGVTSVFAGFDDITATMDEAGTFKLVADGAGADGAAVVTVAAVEKVLTNIVVPETVTSGQYDLYAIDAAGNASATAIDITVEVPDVTAPQFTFPGPTAITTTGSFDYETDEEALQIYVVPQGTASDLEAIKAAALVTILETTTSGTISGITLSEGFYEVYAIDRFGNLGTSGGLIEVADLAGPVAFEVTSGILDKGFPISITINENGHVYVVPAGTDVANVLSAAIVSDTAIASTRAVLPTDGTGFVKGQSYDVYAADGRPNWSELLSTVMIANDPVEEEVILGSDESVGLIVYPNPASNKIYVKGADIQKVELFDMGGRLMLISTESNLDVSQILNGLYVLRIKNNSGFEFKKVKISH